MLQHIQEKLSDLTLNKFVRNLHVIFFLFFGFHFQSRDMFFYFINCGLIFNLIFVMMKFNIFILIFMINRNHNNFFLSINMSIEILRRGLVKFEGV